MEKKSTISNVERSLILGWHTKEELKILDVLARKESEWTGEYGKARIHLLQRYLNKEKLSKREKAAARMRIGQYSAHKQVSKAIKENKKYLDHKGNKYHYTLSGLFRKFVPEQSESPASNWAWCKNAYKSATGIPLNEDVWRTILADAKDTTERGVRIGAFMGMLQGAMLTLPKQSRTNNALIDLVQLIPSLHQPSRRAPSP